MDAAEYKRRTELFDVYIAQGKREGWSKGSKSALSTLIINQLIERFGALTTEAYTRLDAASVAELHDIGERLIAAPTLQEALVPNVDRALYEHYRDFARWRFELGKSLGRTEGQAELLLRLLASRFGPLPADVRRRINAARGFDLYDIGDRLLTAQTLQEALDPVERE